MCLVIFLNLFSNITSILQCFVKENSSNEQKNCIFPFALVTDPDVVYNECTKAEDPRPWCSIQVDAFNVNVKDNWGYCGTGCPGVPKGM